MPQKTNQKPPQKLPRKIPGKSAMTAAATPRAVSAELPRSAHTSPAGGRSTWPDFIQKTRFSYCQTHDPARPTPTAATIDDLDHFVGLLWHLDTAQRQLVWARACNVSWARQVGRRSTEIIGMLAMGVTNDGY